MSQITRSIAGTGAAPVETLTGNSGGAVASTAGNINIVGTGPVTVTGNPGTSTLTIAVTGTGTAWNAVAGTTQPMVADNAYVNQNAGLTTFTLPVTAAFGTIVEIRGSGTGGWLLAQNAGQSIQFTGTTSTTVGVGGSLASTLRFDGVNLVCIVANTTWSMRFANGNITIV